MYADVRLLPTHDKRTVASNPQAFEVIFHLLHIVFIRARSFGQNLSEMVSGIHASVKTHTQQRIIE